MNSISTRGLSIPEENLTRYLHEIRKFPMLSAEEEFELAKEYRATGSPKAVERLVNSHLRLVAKIAMGYRGYGLPLGEMIAEGNIGMMLAVKRYDPDRGFRLATCAMWWIRAAIQEYILHSWSLVKMGTTAAQKKLFFNLRRLKSVIKDVGDGDMSSEHVTKIAEKLNVSEEEVISMNRRLLSPDHSLNAPLRNNSEGEWQDWLVDECDSQETVLGNRQESNQRHAYLVQAMKTLNPREQHIFTQRRLRDTPVTLERLSQEYQISRERVRQIEVRAFEKLQKSIRNAVAHQEAAKAKAKTPQSSRITA